MIYAISDLHLSLRGDKPMDVFGGNWHGYVETIKANWKQTVTKDDTVLLAGDTSWAINLEDAIDDVTAFFSDLEGNKVIIRGNHDYWWNSYAKLSAALPQGVYALQNNCIRFGKDLVCGTRGWSIAGENSSQEDKKIYNRELIRLELSLQAMDKERKEGDRATLMMHYPPMDVHNHDTGFIQLINKYKPDAVVYGHLHGKDSWARIVTHIDGIPYYLTSCDLVGNNLIKIYED